jgi:hypothetical protein
MSSFREFHKNIALPLAFAFGIALAPSGSGCVYRKHIKVDVSEIPAKPLPGSKKSDTATTPAAPSTPVAETDAHHRQGNQELLNQPIEKQTKQLSNAYYEEVLKEPTRPIQELERKKTTSPGTRPEKSAKSLDGAVYGRLPDAERAESASPAGNRAPSVKAGSHDDNEEFPFYRDYCAKKFAKQEIPYPWNISERYIMRILDRDSNSIVNQTVYLADKSGKRIFTATTPASGEFVVFPFMDLGEQYKNISDFRCMTGNATFPVVKGKEDRISIVLPEKRQLPGRMRLQVCFLLDATGSMGDEIRQLQDVIFSIHSRLLSLPARPQIDFSVVAYRDSTDAFVVKGHPFTSNIDSFQIALESVQAVGGGDYPEDMEAGLNYCLDSLAWNAAALKFIFPMGDAPPHLNNKTRNYVRAARLCREKGIMECPIGASGLMEDGEFIYRQLAVITHGEFVFLNYGEKGESDGTATAIDPGKVSHHTGSNYTVRRLDDIVVGIVARELGYCTPQALIAHDFPRPADEADQLETRMVSLLRQVLLPEGMKGKALVLSPFSVSDTSLSPLSEYIWELCLEKLPSLTTATVIERQRLSEVLREHAIGLSGITGQTPDDDLGKILNADFLLLSRMHYLGAVRMCHMRLVDCRTGNILSASRVRL